MLRGIRICVGSLCLALPVLLGADLKEPLSAIRQIETAGKGHPAAIAAAKQLGATGQLEQLPEILAAFDDANPLVVNWLRSAVETIVDRELQAGKALPQAELEAFILATDHHPRARRLAYEVVLNVDPTIEQRLIPGMLNDPSTEFRRDAVARLLTAATTQLEAGEEAAAKPMLLEALQGARDTDQVEAIVKPLEKLGEKVDLPRHFGFVMDWRMIGPFDNKDKKGFDIAYPPETEIDLAGKYAGQQGEVTWGTYETTDKYGALDLAKMLAPHKGAAVYAYSEFEAESARDIEVRLGSPNAWKLWVNGKFLFGRDEYHRGKAIDQYRVPAKLQAGKNTILLKICQNEQTEDWAQDWQFQLRVCDATGTAVLSQTRPPTKEPIVEKPAEAKEQDGAK